MGLEMSMKVGKKAREEAAAKKAAAATGAPQPVDDQGGLKGSLSAANLRKLGKNDSWPTKTDINLAAEPVDKTRSPLTVIIFIIVLIIIVLFAKFGVVDVMGAAMSANAKVSSVQTQIATLQKEDANYDEVAATYAGIASNAYTDEEKTYVDRNKVLDLLQSDFVSGDNLQSVVVTGNTATLTFSDTSLEAASGMVAQIEANPIVQSVKVSSGKKEKDTSDTVSTVVTITFVPASTSSTTTTGKAS